MSNKKVQMLITNYLLGFELIIQKTRRINYVYK